MLCAFDFLHELGEVLVVVRGKMSTDFSHLPRLQRGPERYIRRFSLLEARSDHKVAEIRTRNRIKWSTLQDESPVVIDLSHIHPVFPHVLQLIKVDLLLGQRSSMEVECHPREGVLHVAFIHLVKSIQREFLLISVKMLVLPEFAFFTLYFWSYVADLIEGEMPVVLTVHYMGLFLLVDFDELESPKEQLFDVIDNESELKHIRSRFLINDHLHRLVFNLSDIGIFLFSCHFVRQFFLSTLVLVVKHFSVVFTSILVMINAHVDNERGVFGDFLLDKRDFFLIHQEDLYIRTILFLENFAVKLTNTGHFFFIFFFAVLILRVF